MVEDSQHGLSLHPSTINKVHHAWRLQGLSSGEKPPSPHQAFLIAYFLSTMEPGAVKEKEILGGLGRKHITKPGGLAEIQ